MRAWLCEHFGSPTDLRLVDWPCRAPGPGEVRIRIRAAALNYPDLLSIAGKYPIPSTPPFIPGVEGAGEIVECGAEVTELAPGMRVCWQNNEVKASFAEEITLPTAAIARIPADLDTAIAAAVPTAYGTAFFALTNRAILQSGETLVVHGASGGVGLACVQLGKMLGATVIATGANDSKLAIIKECGADHVVNTTRESVRDQVLSLTGGRGADVVCDPVGGEVFDQSMRAIAPLGRILVIGFTSGSFPLVKANILLVKAASVIGANYGHFLRTRPAEATAAIEAMLGSIAAGRLAPRVHARLRFEACVEGLQSLADRKVVGKCVLVMESP